MAYDLTRPVTTGQLKKVAERVKQELGDSMNWPEDTLNYYVGTHNGWQIMPDNGMDWPANDGKYYAARNGEWVEIAPMFAGGTETGGGAESADALKWTQRTGISPGSSYNYIYIPTIFTIGNKTIAGFASNNNYVYLKETVNGVNWSNFSINSVYIQKGAFTYNSANNSLYVVNSAGQISILDLTSHTITSSFSSRTSLNSNSPSLCYSPELDAVLVFGGSGQHRKIYTDGTLSDVLTSPEVSNLAISATGDFVWSDELKIFCIAGSYGTAVSADGDNWTTQTDTQGLSKLMWIPEKHAFYAWKTNVPCISNDGLHWFEMSAHALSFTSSVPEAVCWSPELGMFCIAPSESTQYLYISRDLKSWGKLELPASVSIAGITWNANINMFIAVRSSSTYAELNTYYTLEL